MTLQFDGSHPGPPVGPFTYLINQDAWTWSDGMYEIHGLAPQAVESSTEVLLRHKHPDDRARAYEVLETAVHDGRPFSCYHRIIDAKRSVRSVLSVGRGVRGDSGDVERIVGFFADLTNARRDEVQRDVDEALLRIAETRSVIDQAKGMVMVAHGCDSEQAFEVLRERSSTMNLKLNLLALHMVETVAQGSDAGLDALATVARVLGDTREQS